MHAPRQRDALLAECAVCAVLGRRLLADVASDVQSADAASIFVKCPWKAMDLEVLQSLAAVQHLCKRYDHSDKHSGQALLHGGRLQGAGQAEGILCMRAARRLKVDERRI